MKAKVKNTKIEKIPGVDSVIVSVNFTHGDDNSVLIVGHRTENGITDIYNAIQGKEAEELYYKLLGTKAEEFKAEIVKLRER